MALEVKSTLYPWYYMWIGGRIHLQRLGATRSTALAAAHTTKGSQTARRGTPTNKTQNKRQPDRVAGAELMAPSAISKFSNYAASQGRPDLAELLPTEEGAPVEIVLSAANASRLLDEEDAEV